MITSFLVRGRSLGTFGGTGSVGPKGGRDDVRTGVSVGDDGWGNVQLESSHLVWGPREIKGN